jgi:hypothetical protein
LRHAFPRTTKEPALSRRHRHRASGVASRGELGTAAAHHAPNHRRRARTILGLSFVCGALLIAAPIALVIGGSPDGSGSPREPDGIFTGEDDGATDGGTGRGGGGLSTTSTQSPSPTDPADAAADGGVTPAGAGPVNAGGGTAARPGGGAAAVGGTTGGGGSGGATVGSGTTGSGSGATAAGSNGGTAAGSNGDSTGGSGGGTGGSGGSNPGGGSNPAPAEPEPQPEPKPCPCEKVGDALEDPVGTVEGTLGGVVPKLPNPLG